jgi:hypothetical protein
MDKQLRTIIYLVILTVLIIITGIVLSINRKSTLSAKSTQFAFKDTQSIKKIFMADMLGKNVLLERTQNGWIVNGKYEANQARIDLLLETIATIEVKNPVPLSTQDYVVRDMATGAIKVEIYTNKMKPVKVYYVGGSTPDYLGTYMVLESRKKIPYVVYKPGLNGYLSEGYYFTDEAEWRTKVVFNIDPVNIQQVEIQYEKEPDSSFILQTSTNNSYQIRPVSMNKSVSFELNHKKVRHFLMGFSNLQYMEVVEYTSRPHFKDSLLMQTPVIKVILTETGKKAKTLSLYSKPADQSTKAVTELSFDPGYFYAHVDDRPEQIFLMQDLVLERILWKINDFKK